MPIVPQAAGTFGQKGDRNGIFAQLEFVVRTCEDISGPRLSLGTIDELLGRSPEVMERTLRAGSP
jgi:hypothetical protein